MTPLLCGYERYNFLTTQKNIQYNAIPYDQYLFPQQLEIEHAP